MAFSLNLRVLVVAKPWAGGLGLYVHQALLDLLGPERATLISTRPQSLAESIQRATNRNAWEQRLIQRIESANYDAAIFIQPPMFLSPLANAQKHILWMVDDTRGAEHWSSAMGHIFISDPGYLAEAQAAIPPAAFAGVLPFAMLPILHSPAAQNSATKSPMCFIANRDAKRTQWLTRLFAAGLKCHVYGNYFLRDRLHLSHPLSFRPSVPLSALQSVYAQHHLSLNIHANVVRHGTNMRSFEAAGYGIPQLVEHRPGIETLFDPITELPCFTSVEEAKSLYEKLLREPDVAQKIAATARTRVLAEHTYQHRVKTMLARI